LNKQCFHLKFVQRAAVYLRRKKIHKALLKLDIAKTFDTVSWPFLLDSLRGFGFGEHWRRWVATLLASPSSRILLNGIQHRRGVRQGDSLSPMLFIIVMEAFAPLVHSAAESRLLR